MQQLANTHIMGVDVQQLAPLVCKVLQQDNAEIVAWHYEILQGGVGDLGAGLVGVYRFYGQAQSGDSLLPWSIVLKSIRSATESENAAYLLREWDAYHSNFLAALNGPVVAPTCLATSQQPGGLSWIWLEHLVDADPQPWTVAHYTTVAQHFGQWNGRYLTGEPAPEYPWFCRSTAQEWTEQAAPEIEFLRTIVEHPLVQRLYPEGQANAILQLWDERERFFEALASLPQTIGHNDAFHRNLFGRRRPNGCRQTVAIDWAYVGQSAIGEEVAAMVIGNLGFGGLDWSLAPEVATEIFGHYLIGLQTSGWSGDPQVVRLGFTAAAVMKYCFPYTLRAMFSEQGQAWLAKVQQQKGDPFAAAFQKRAFLFKLAAEARQIMHEHA